MINKIIKLLKPVSIDVLIYRMTIQDYKEFENLNYKIEKRIISKNKKQFFIIDNDKVIHKSNLFKKVFLLKIIHKKGPVIGDCMTINEYKGKSIYPFVINYIAYQELVHNNKKEIFVIVNKENISSIKGIEKAGYKLYAKINAKRFLLFYYDIIKN